MCLAGPVTWPDTDEDPDQQVVRRGSPGTIRLRGWRGWSRTSVNAFSSHENKGWTLWVPGCGCVFLWRQTSSSLSVTCSSAFFCCSLVNVSRSVPVPDSHEPWFVWNYFPSEMGFENGHTGRKSVKNIICYERHSDTPLIHQEFFLFLLWRFLVQRESGCNFLCKATLKHLSTLFPLYLCFSLLRGLRSFKFCLKFYSSVWSGSIVI